MTVQRWATIAAAAAMAAAGCGTTKVTTAPGEAAAETVSAPNPKQGAEQMVDDVSKVWAGVRIGPSGLWLSGTTNEPGPQADTSGYTDTTDDRKGAITASDAGLDGEGSANAFDNTPAKWCLRQGSMWIAYQYADGAKHAVCAYTITSANDMPNRDPKDWKLYGSNDASTWTELDSRSGESFSSRYEKRLFPVKSPAEYSCYKLEVSSNHGDPLSQLSEIELLVKKGS